MLKRNKKLDTPLLVLPSRNSDLSDAF